MNENMSYNHGTYCVLTIVKSYLVLYTRVGVENFQHGKRLVSVSGKNKTGVCILLLQRIEINYQEMVQCA